MKETKYQTYNHLEIIVNKKGLTNFQQNAFQVIKLRSFTFLKIEMGELIESSKKYLIEFN